MNDLQTIDLTSLDNVSGGELGPNQTRASGELSVQTPMGVNVSGRGEYQSNRTDYAQCLDMVRGASGTPQDMRAICGPPPGTAPTGAGQ